jgi:RNA polymerase sigma-70 factor (ECF subfamily)
VSPAGEPSRGLLPRALDLLKPDAQPARTPARVKPPASVARASVGIDAQEFQRLYDLHARAILAYLLAVTRRRDLADDLLQETFVRLLTRAIPPMDPDASRRYLFRIATNLLRDRWRSGEATPHAEPPEPTSSTDLDTPLDVRAALAHLKPRERELLWLAYVEGMDHAEIAAATGLQRLSVRMLLFRARKKAALLLQHGRISG